jgi:four helix bundle protein
MDLVEAVYRARAGFPGEERFGLTAQLRRAAVSVPANIAEGHCREHIREYLNFLSIAQGSPAELETQVEIAGRLGYLGEVDLGSLAAQATSLAKQIRALRAQLGRRGRDNA